MEQGPADLWAVVRGNGRAGFECHDYAARVLHEPL